MSAGSREVKSGFYEGRGKEGSYKVDRSITLAIDQAKRGSKKGQYLSLIDVGNGSETHREDLPEDKSPSIRFLLLQSPTARIPMQSHCYDLFHCDSE